jgi:hypothetical protein
MSLLKRTAAVDCLVGQMHTQDLHTGFAGQWLDRHLFEMPLNNQLSQQSLHQKHLWTESVEAAYQAWTTSAAQEAHLNTSPRRPFCLPMLGKS